MRRLRQLIACLAAACALTTVLGAVPAGAAVDTASMETRFLELLNKQRASAGLGLLPLDGATSDVARTWSAHMAATSTLYHNPNLAGDIERSVTTQWVRIGENVGRGGSVDRLHRAFWDSPGHRANILGDYNRLGIGVVVDARGIIWVTFNFVKGPYVSGPVGIGTCRTPGYLLDAYGGVHPFGGAAGVKVSGYWSGWDIARDLDFAASTGRGYVLDGFGGLHPVDGAPALRVSGYWPGWDIAEAVAVTPDGKGAYVLDPFGGIHAAGAAKAVRPGGYWHGWHIARDIDVDPSHGARGYVLDGYGGLHPFGGMPAARLSWYGGVARSVSLLPDGSGGYVVDRDGNMHPFAVGSAPMPASRVTATPASLGNALGGVVKSSAAVYATASGGEVGITGACATRNRWGGWNIIRAVAVR